MALPRCETGVAGLDQILRGGIPRGNVVLLAGGPGLGKTSLSLAFLARGADEGENGVLLTFTEPVAVLERNVREYRFVDPEHLDGGRLRLLDLRTVLERLGHSAGGRVSPEDAARLADVLVDVVQECGARRLVLDSITALCHRLADPDVIRDFVFRLGYALSELDCTTLMTSETPPRALQYGRFDVEEFIADGIVFLGELERRNDLLRTLQVMKMRGTEHSRTRHMLDLSALGVAVAPLLSFGEGDT